MGIRVARFTEELGRLDDASDAIEKALTTPNINVQLRSVAQAKKDEVLKRKGVESKLPASPREPEPNAT